MGKVQVTSSIAIRAPPEIVWKYLCDAHMPTAPWCFQFGVPTPKTCRIVGETTGVGAHRQCQTNQGFVDQRITEWLPPRRLTFVATSDTIGLYRHIREMHDTFTLEQTSDSTTLTRQTNFETIGALSFIKAIIFKTTVKRIHRFTMKGFKALAEA
ncbi:MAG: SRPBCC family protein [Nitrososphaera sp.]|jgi:uncharacterized protein YndB with AHSA1/START domain